MKSLVLNIYFVNMLMCGLLLFVIGFGAAIADLECHSFGEGPARTSVCTHTATPSNQVCGGAPLTTTVVISTTGGTGGGASANLDCGTVTAQGEHQNGDSVETARLGEVPWHAGVYAKAFKPYKQICEGTIVSANVVISSAHCFWNTTSEALLVPRQPASRYAVAVGKLLQPWDAPADGHAQKSDVREINIPVRFRGSVTNYQEDIAVLKLETTIQFNSYVRPVCLDFDYIFEKSQLTPAKYGKIASWSIPESESTQGQGRALQVQELPYVDTAQCYDEAPRSFRPFITSDKFCAFGKDSFSVLCRGGAGGGLAFAAEERGVTRYYLRGIVSTSAVYRDDGCSQFIGFTQLAKHEHFIKDHLK